MLICMFVLTDNDNNIQPTEGGSQIHDSRSKSVKMYPNSVVIHYTNKMEKLTAAKMEIICA